MMTIKPLMEAAKRKISQKEKQPSQELSFT
jgi:hypothetical protein